MNPFSEVNAKIAAEGKDYTDSYAEEYYYDDEDDGGLFSAEAAPPAAPSGHCPGQFGCSNSLNIIYLSFILFFSGQAYTFTLYW